MLSIGKLSLGQEAYYLQEVLDGAEDYYLNAGEAPGRWTGRGAGELRLVGPVNAEELRAVLSGADPRDDVQLRATTASVPGFDLTLSAPKSVSLVWGLSDSSTAAAVVQCHEAGVDAAISYMENHACRLRRGHAGAETVSGDGFVAAAFRHRTSRLEDPALHTHVLVANLARGPDGRWTALDARAIYQHARTAGFVYQAVLRHELARTQGLLFEEVAKGYADVAGVPPSLRDEFSGRRREIVEAMERHGTTSARSAQAAALETRLAKRAEVSESELRGSWALRAEPSGFSVDDLPRLVRTPELHVVDAALAATVTEREATFERRDVVRAVAQAATQGASLDAIEDRADLFLGSAAVVEVAEARWTTPEILALEERAISVAVDGVGTKRGIAATKDVREALAARPSLDAEQRQAVRALTRSGNAVDVMVGPAGTGKTFSLDAAREAWDVSGYRVIGAALAARAAAQLDAGAGIPSQTVDRLLVSLVNGRERLDEHTVLVVDEAAMVGTRRLAAVLAEAHAAATKVVLIGDPKQLPEIDAGGLFSGLAARIGAVELTVNRRQRDRQERATVDDLRDGNVEQAIARLRRHGRLSVADNAEALREALVRDWHAARKSGDHVEMLASQRSSVLDLNRRARRLLEASGELGETVLRVGDLKFAAGDRVLALRNDYEVGVLNGDRGVVRTCDGQAVILELEDARTVKVPVGYVVNGDLGHGYASTIHKAQGLTCDRAFILGDDSYTIELGYTSLTRGRDRNQLYIVAASNEHAHGKELSRDALASFTAALHRSGAKTAAVDVRQPPPALGR